MYNDDLSKYRFNHFFFFFVLIFCVSWKTKMLNGKVKFHFVLWNDQIIFFSFLPRFACKRRRNKRKFQIKWNKQIRFDVSLVCYFDLFLLFPFFMRTLFSEHLRQHFVSFGIRNILIFATNELSFIVALPVIAFYYAKFFSLSDIFRINSSVLSAKNDNKKMKSLQ